MQEEESLFKPMPKKVDEREAFPPYGELRVIQLESGTAWHVFAIDTTPARSILPYLAGLGWTTRLEDRRYWFFAERDKEMEATLSRLRAILACPTAAAAPPPPASATRHKFSDLNVSKIWRQPLPGLRLVKYSEKHVVVVGDDLKTYVDQVVSCGGAYRENLKFGLGAGFLLSPENAEQFVSRFE